jgi:hypothetical protein
MLFASFLFLMEEKMRLLNAIRMISAEIKHRVVIHHQLSHFTCGDCEEGNRCGRLPSDDCIERAVQIERDGDQPRSRALRGFKLPTD